MKCSDCGNTDGVPNLKGRADICPTCTDLRMRLVTAMHYGKHSIAEFQELQRTIANSHGSGRGAAAMRRFLGLDGPQI